MAARGGIHKMRWVLGIVAAVCLGLAIATVRVIASGEDEIAASTAALDAGDVHEAIVRARRAAGWYAPGAAHVRVAYERLVALARAAEEHRQFDNALLAWRAVRTAAIETTWVLTPHAADLERANLEIARLSALAERAPDSRAVDIDVFARDELRLLSAGERPRLVWSVALVAGLVVVAAGLGLLARELPRPPARGLRRYLGFGLVVLGVGLWVVSLWRA